MKSLQLQWDNTENDEITLHPGVEKPLNIVFIQRHNSQVFPCVFADIPIARIVETFRTRPGVVEAYEFDVYVTSSDRHSGELVSTLPAKAIVRLRATDDPQNPYVEVIPEGTELAEWAPGQ